MKRIFTLLIAYLSIASSYAQSTFPVDGGNVGIGTLSPLSKLNIWHSTVNGDGLHIDNSSNAAYFTLYVNGSLGYNVLKWANSTVLESVPASGGGLVMSSYTGDINFQTNNRSNRMTITSGGNVGIGTTSPAASLDIGGQIQISGISSSTPLRV